MADTSELYDFDHETPKNELLEIISTLHDALKRERPNNKKCIKEKTELEKQTDTRYEKSEMIHENMEIQKYEMKELIIENIELETKTKKLKEEKLILQTTTERSVEKKIKKNCHKLYTPEFKDSQQKNTTPIFLLCTPTSRNILVKSFSIKKYADFKTPTPSKFKVVPKIYEYSIE